jgi:hypothetical protein
MGYGAQEINAVGISDTDYLALGIMLSLSILVLLFAYMHSNSQSYVWSQLWFFMACLMVIADLIAAYSFATTSGDTAIENVSLALFVGFIWLFILSLVIFLWTLVKDFIFSLRAMVKRG